MSGNISPTPESPPSSARAIVVVGATSAVAQAAIRRWARAVEA